nr:beta-N-acetylhexosaminidase [Shewanella gelidii]
MLDVDGVILTQEERKRIAHPMVGGLILFSRNYQNRQQLIELVQSIRAVKPEILIAVDQEGGRVQRFIEGFTKIPAMGDILLAAKGDSKTASAWAEELGFLMAIELMACDIDLSFAPVLDLNGVSKVIGSRSFAGHPQQVIEIASRFVHGMHQAGMQSVGKHFPGHGSVVADSHIDLPVDDRPMAQIAASDILPFAELISNGLLEGVMPAHVVYSKVDSNTAGFSKYWLQDILRGQLKFDGVIFSDDLGMKGASVAGSYCERAKAALTAGCDMILLCNDSQGVDEVIQGLDWPLPNVTEHVSQALRLNRNRVAVALEDESRWQQAKTIALSIGMNKY